MLRRAEPLLFVALRVVTGLMLALHGSQRIFGYPPGEQATEPMRLAASAIELVCGLLVALGLFTSWAALLAGVTMAIGFAMRRTELLALDALLFLWIATRAPAPPPPVSPAPPPFPPSPSAPRS